MSYYRIVDGKRMDDRLLSMAEESVKGAGDGRISKNDAEAMIQAVKDGDQYTDIEKETMAYIRDNFQWTETADEWFRGQIASWAASGHPN